MNCPICDCSYYEPIKLIECESFDDSYLYKDIYINKCNQCGHIYNELTTILRQNLVKYYKYEYAPSNLSSTDKIGDKPGSDTTSNIKRYEQVFYFIEPYITKNSRILDVGCAMGGFLNYLKLRGYKNLYGIDPIEEYVEEANNDNIKVGNAYLIPFGDDYFDIVILDQVLEHLGNLKMPMREIYRVLSKGGLCYIGVPDAERYNDIYFYIMREHIQHFNIKNLKLLAQKYNFEVININKTKTDMIGTLKLPNLSVLLKVGGKVYCWGIGREFMYLYLNTRLKKLNIVLVDDTPYKQKQTFKGKNIFPSSILENTDKDSFLIITATVHKEKLKKKALEIGYKGEIINV